MDRKASRCFLGLNSPFYAGCPNAADYFPKESFIQIDLNDAAGAVKIVNQAMKKQEFERRLPAILEARRRVLFEHNLFAVLSREIEKRFNPGVKYDLPSYICSRHAIRYKNPINVLNDISGKLRAKIKHFAFQ